MRVIIKLTQKQRHSPFFVLLMVVTLAASLVFPTIQVLALSRSEKDAIDRNSVHYKTSSPSGGTGSCSAETVGNNPQNAAYVWNFFAGKDLTPIAIAGIMGNFSEETGATFDPAIKQNNTVAAIPANGDGTTGFGVAQWTYQARQAGLFSKMRAANLDKYYGEGWGNPEINKTEMPREDIEKLLDVELLYAWEQDSTQIKSVMTQLNHATTVEGDGGSTLIFHRDYEGSGDSASQLQERVIAAQRYLAQFGNSAGCNEQLGGVEAIEDAVPWAHRFMDDTKAEYPGSSLAVARPIDDPRAVSGSGGTIMSLATWPESTSSDIVCWHASGCDECTTVSGWFVIHMTSYQGYLGGDGGEVVGNLRAIGVPTGDQPRPFSIFSYDTGSFGHTGLVLSVKSDGTVITLENNWPSNTLSIRQYNIKRDYPGATFAYVSDKMNQPGGGDDE
jgi:surface antigen